MTLNVHASGSSGNFYTVSCGPSSLAIEAGVLFKRIQEYSRFRVSRLSGCLVSHHHGDHACAVPKLLERGIDCYMSEQTAEKLQCVGHHRAKIMAPLERMEVGPFSVLPLDVKHDAGETGTLSFVVDAPDGDRLLYVTDAHYLKYCDMKGITHFAMPDLDKFIHRWQDRVDKIRKCRNAGSVNALLAEWQGKWE